MASRIHAPKRQPLSARSKNGLFSTALIALGIAITLLFNLAVGQIPEHWRSFDLSDNRVYTLSGTAKDYLADLSTGVELTAVAGKDDTDQRIVTFLERCAALTDQLTLEWIDPVAYPSALTDYSCEANTLILTCPSTDRTYQVPFDDILVPDTYYSYYTSTPYYTSFDGEGQLLSALDYVTSDVSHQMYCTENHGEAALGERLADLLKKSRFTTTSLSLLQQGRVPEDCSLLLINAPTSDFSEEELGLVTDYLASGGKVQLVFGPQSFAHPNLDKLLDTYGLALTEGYVGDTSRFYAAAQNYFTFFPELTAGTGAAKDVASDALVLVSAAFGLTLDDPARDTISVEPFLSTSSNGVQLQGEDTVSGTYTLGAAATETLKDGETSQLTVFSTDSLIDDSINAQFSGSVANLTVFMNTVADGFDDVTHISIEPKSLQTPTNTVSNAGLWSLIYVAALPLLFLGLGFFRWFRRRRL